MVEVLGIIGSICFALCSFPQAYLTHKQGHADGVSTAYVVLWLLGEICTLAYIPSLNSAPLYVNYVCNLMCLFVILKYKVFPRRDKVDARTPDTATLHPTDSTVD